MQDQNTIESQPRATGQTTRMIDEVIQWIFNNPDCWLTIRDHASTNSQQPDNILLDKILTRLKNEHYITTERQKSGFNRDKCIQVDRSHTSIFIKLRTFKEEDKPEEDASEAQQGEAPTQTVKLNPESIKDAQEQKAIENGDLTAIELLLSKTYYKVNEYLDNIKEYPETSKEGLHEHISNIIQNVTAFVNTFIYAEREEFRHIQDKRREEDEQQNRPFQTQQAYSGVSQSYNSLKSTDGQLYTHQQVKDTLIELKELLTKQQADNKIVTTH